MVLCRLSYEGNQLLEVIWCWSHQPISLYSLLVGRVGFEPTKAMPPILQTGPAHHLRRLPQSSRRLAHDSMAAWSRRWELNPQPHVYKTRALPIELRRQNGVKIIPDSKEPSQGSCFPDWLTSESNRTRGARQWQNAPLLVIIRSAYVDDHILGSCLPPHTYTPCLPPHTPALPNAHTILGP
jgi:hypothetical protein